MIWNKAPAVVCRWFPIERSCPKALPAFCRPAYPENHEPGNCPLAYDEEAVKKNMEKRMQESGTMHSGCPGSMMHTLNPVVSSPSIDVSSQLTSWPVQIKLAPINAPFFQHAKLLIAADCTAYAYANFHQEFMKNKVTLIGCPKLDGVDYSEKLCDIIRMNSIESVTIVRMEVPCCGGLENAVKKALQESKKFIPWQVVTISIDGKILD